MAQWVQPLTGALHERLDPPLCDCRHRVIPPLRATEEAALLALPSGTLTEQGRAVLGAVASGELAPGQGAALLAAIGTLARVVELDELARRVAALEGNDGNP